MADLQVSSATVQLQDLDGEPQTHLENGDAPPQVNAQGADTTISNTVTETKQRWNHPRQNMWKVFTTFICFSVVGANDGAYGVKSSPHFIFILEVLIELTPFLSH